MKPLRFKVNFELPLRYESVIWNILAHLQANPKEIGKKEGDIIFTKYIYQYCVDVTMDHLELDFNDGEKEVLEFVGSKTKKSKEWLLNKLESDIEFRKNEYKLAGKLSPEQLKEYESNYMPEGISMQEYLAIKESLG